MERKQAKVSLILPEYMQNYFLAALPQVDGDACELGDFDHASHLLFLLD